MKKGFIGLLILLVSVLIGTTVNPAVFAEAKEPVTISFWFPGADQVNDTYFSGAAKEFEKTHPRIKVAVTVLPAAQADIELKLNAAMLAGTFPDVFSAYLNFIGTRGPLGDFLPLNSYINKWPDRSDIYESAINTGMYKNKIIGLGFFPAPEILTYRKDYFKNAGLDPEKPPTSWEELEEYAKKLTKRDGNGNVIRAGLDIPAINASVFFRPLMRQNGSLVINEKKEIPVFTDKNSIEAWDFFIKLKNANVSIPYNYQKKETIPFLNGNAAMSFLQSTQIATMIKNNPEMAKNLGYAPVLSRKKKVCFCGYRLFTIGSSSKHKKESWEFIKFMMSKEQMRKRYKDLNIPVVRKSLESEFIADDPALNQTQIEYIKYGKGAENVPWLTMAMKHLHLAWEEAYNNKKTPAQALKDAETNLKKDLKSAK
jgi:ABC-type glycerol-3-phosphate transport system substrate-binding protein